MNEPEHTGSGPPTVPSPNVLASALHEWAASPHDCGIDRHPLRTGTPVESVLQLAGRLLAEQQGLRGIASLDTTQLIDEHGMGLDKATTTAAAFELGRRLAVEGDVPRPAVTTPADIARQLQAEMKLLPQEEVLTLDTRHRLLSKTTLYRGSLNSTPARVADLFREAVRQNAFAIAIAHNHPSGDPASNLDDIQFTKTIVAAGQLMQIEVLDHLVFGHGRYVSL